MKIRYLVFNLSFFCLYVLTAFADQTCMSLAPFNKIVLQGKMRVQILAAQQEPRLYINASAAQLNTTAFKVKDQVLTIQASALASDPELIIHAPAELRALKANGDIQVKVSGLHSQDFSLTTANKAEVNLQGVIALKRLVAQGTGSIKIYWLDTPHLTIEAKDSSHILLGGRVATLHANLKGQSFLDARYLINEKAYLKTTEHARIDISTQQVLEAQAKGQSNIYYYKKPQFLGQHMLQSGTLLNRTGEAMGA